MSDRIADKADEIRTQILNIAEQCEDEKYHMAQRAANEMEGIAKLDREQNGPTPTDKLVAIANESPNQCVICGEKTDGAVFCSFSCLKENTGSG